jgi:hypothetical protein
VAPSAAAPTTQRAALQLPLNVMTRADINRLIRELESLENFLMQARARQAGQSLQLPRLSLLLEHIASDNHLNLLVEDDRQHIRKLMDDIYQHAPVVHVSFASNPSAAFSGKVLAWFRTEVHPYCLLQIGLQPALGAGFILRTTNKYFNFSLGRYFDAKKDILKQLMEKGADEPAPVNASTAATAADQAAQVPAGAPVAASTEAPASQGGEHAR